MVNNITSHNHMNNSSVNSQNTHLATIGQSTNSNGQQYDQSQQYEPFLCQTSKSNGKQYHHPQQYEPLLCQTSNSNGQHIAGHNNMKHTSVKHQIVMLNNITSTRI
jgi:hypothetical protein